MTREEAILCLEENIGMLDCHQRVKDAINTLLSTAKVFELQGLDEAPKKKLRKVCNLREDLKDGPIEEKLAELRKIRTEKDRLDEAAVKYQIETYGPRVIGGANVLSDEEYMQWNKNKDFIAGAEWMARQGVSMQVTDDTEWSEVDLVVHKNVCEGSIIQIRNK